MSGWLANHLCKNAFLAIFKCVIERKCSSLTVRILKLFRFRPHGMRLRDVMKRAIHLSELVEPFRPTTRTMWHLTQCTICVCVCVHIAMCIRAYVYDCNDYCEQCKPKRKLQSSMIQLNFPYRCALLDAFCYKSSRRGSTEIMHHYFMWKSQCCRDPFIGIHNQTNLLKCNILNEHKYFNQKDEEKKTEIGRWKTRR